jgi:synapsin
LELSFGKGPKHTSAPSSPAKSRESLLQRVQSLTGAARDQGASIIGAAASTVSRVQAFNKDRCFTLLVIDDQNTDWSKYFRGKRIGDYDIRVEQAEFSEISVVASGDSGPSVSIVRLSKEFCYELFLCYYYFYYVPIRLLGHFGQTLFLFVSHPEMEQKIIDLLY